MSGNLWMFSDMLDDEDAKMIQHEFVTYYEGADYYGLGLKVFTRLAHEAGAVYKIGKRVLIRRDIFEEYLRILRRKEDTSEMDENMKSEDNDMRQGALTLDAQTGRMDIRFDLENYYGGLHCGECLDILINGEWVPTRIEMGDGWYLAGIKTDHVEGLIVRI
jgi:hypothetical protein